MSKIFRGLTDALISELDQGVVDHAIPESRIPTERYCSQAQLDAERRVLFSQLPIIVAQSAEVAEIGQSLVDTSTGRSVVIVRAKDGVLRAFINACRHRGTRLADSSCSRKAFVCPYHGWTYGLDGELLSIPHEEAFETLEPSRRRLVSVSVAERHGFVWLGASSSDQVGAHLGPLDADLDAFGLASHHVFVTTECEREANWKLVIDLFLEGYHLRTLHRNSIYPFFLDARGKVGRYGDHVGAVSARKTIAEATPADLDRSLRDYVTPNFLIFPNTILIAHPDYFSRLSVYPTATNRFRWVHSILIENEPTTDKEREHWQRSADLIEGQVFQKEDLWMAEQMQQGIEAGADTELVIGKLESGIRWFHESIEHHISSASADLVSENAPNQGNPIVQIRSPRSG